jgi:hypothetical protein
MFFKVVIDVLMSLLTHFCKKRHWQLETWYWVNITLDYCTHKSEALGSFNFLFCVHVMKFYSEVIREKASDSRRGPLLLLGPMGTRHMATNGELEIQ